MIITPYDTRACIGYAPSIAKLSDSIKKAYLLGGGFNQLTWDSVSNTSACLVLPDVNGTIRPFGHPIFVEGIRGGDNILVADARSMYSVNPSTQEVRPKVAMSTALSWIEVRLRLQLLWSSANFPIVQTCMDYPIMLYGKVMSESLARKYGLEPVNIARCDMLFAYAYWCFSHTEEQYKRTDKESLAHLLAMTIKSTGIDIASVIANLDYFHTINDVVEALKDEDVTGTQRMSSITLAALYEISSSLWYITAGAPAQEIVACALEHPPTWMACIYTSLSNPSFKNNIVKVADRYKRMMNPDQYINGVRHLLGDQ